MNKEKKLIPELRFPEFKKDGEWQEKQLQDILDYERPDNYTVSDTNYLKKGTPVLTANKSFILGYTNEDSGIFTDLPAIIFDDFTVDSKFVDFPFKVKSSAIKILKPKKKGDLRFIFELMSQIRFDAKEHKRYYISVFQQLIVPVPKPQEQQKIASCLSALDELLSAHNDKLQTLKDHKKGLMQNLFPQEGQKVPRFRFPEFEKDGDWVEKELEKVCEVNPKVGELPDEFVYIDLESVSDGLLLKRNIIKKKGAPSRAQRLLQNKDVIYQMVRPYQKNNYYFIKGDNYEYVASTGYAQLRAFNSKKFLFQLIHTERFVSSVLDKCTGSNYPAINSSALKQIKVQVPTKKIEQQKIATCLSALDELITVQTEKIEQLQQHKKGLMQGLFPKIV